MSNDLPFSDLEKVYDLIAAAVDAAGPEKESLFLAKLCMTLAHRIPQFEVIEKAIAIAGENLEI